MPNSVHRVDPPDDEELLEQWTRDDADDLTTVEALLPDDHPWQVVVGMAEFLRAEPLETQMSEAVHAAIGGVPGVTGVAREDTEVWLAWGTPDGVTWCARCRRWSTSWRRPPGATGRSWRRPPRGTGTS